MSFIADLIAGGIWPLQHFEDEYSIGKRIVRKAARVSRNPEQDGMFEVHETVGDVVCGFMWPFLRGKERKEPAWAWAFPAVVTKAGDTCKDSSTGTVDPGRPRGIESDGRRRRNRPADIVVGRGQAGAPGGLNLQLGPGFGRQGAGSPGGFDLTGINRSGSGGGEAAGRGSGGAAGASSTGGAAGTNMVAPIMTGEHEPYTKGLAELAPNLPDFAAPLLKGWSCTISAGVNEKSQEQVALPSFLGLVAPHENDGDYGTRVFETKKDKAGDHEPDRDLFARLQTFWRVITPTGPLGSINTLAWRFSPAESCPGGGGHGLIFNDGVVGAASSGRSGPFRVDGGCPHSMGTGPHGEQYPVHP